MAQKTWNCTRISQSKNEGHFWIGWIAMVLFIFFAIFLLFATFVSVIGLENIDLISRLTQYFNPETNPFVWVLIVLFGISLFFIAFAGITRKSCTNTPKAKSK